MTWRANTCIYTNMAARRYQLPDLDDLRTQRHVCFAEQLRAANRAINKLYTRYLEGTDIGIAQMSLLVRLYYLGEVTVSRLARMLETDRTTLTRSIQLLQLSGHVEVCGAADRRKRLVRLTDKGFASLETAIPLWRKAQENLRDRLGQALWDDLFRGLRELARTEPD